MTLETLVKAGTITLVQGSTNVVGLGTNWLVVGIREGDWLQDAVTGQLAIVDHVTSDTELTLIQPWAHVSGAGNAFAIVPQGDLTRAAESNTMIRKWLEGQGVSGELGATVGLPDNADGEDGDGRLDYSTAQLYKKENGAWAIGATLKGANGANSYTYVGYATDNQGADFSIVRAPTHTYLAVKVTSNVIANPVASDFDGLWFKQEGTDGAGTIAAGTFTYTDAGTLPTVSNSGTPENAIIDLTGPFPINSAGIEFGNSDVVNVNYIASRGADLFTNGTALLDNTYNLPAAFSVDKKVTPNLPASFEYEGYYSGVHTTSEFLPIDPNKIYKLQSYLYEEDYNHLQYMAVEMYDADKFAIVSQNSMRWFEGAFDSATTLTVPLTPGDTSISVADAAGWNETSASDWNRGVIIFEYKNSFGFKYDDFSRLIEADLFELGDVNKATNTIALNKAFPVALANPDDANGTWPIGTKIANSRLGATRKYAFYAGLRVPTLGDWYKTENYIGGIDKSGKNYSRNFSPGCAFCKISWLASYSNRSGGNGAHPDSGANHKVRYAGISVIPAQNASLSNNADGSKSIHVAKLNSLGQWDYLTNTSPIIEVL